MIPGWAHALLVFAGVVAYHVGKAAVQKWRGRRAR